MSEKEISKSVRGKKKSNKSFEAQWLTKFSKSMTDTIEKGTAAEILGPASALPTDPDSNDSLQNPINLTLSTRSQFWYHGGCIEDERT